MQRRQFTAVYFDKSKARCRNGPAAMIRRAGW